MTGHPARPLRKTIEAGGMGRGPPDPVESQRGPDPTRKLPRWTGKKLHSLMPLVYRKKTMAAAWDDVKRNKGAPGVDGESVEAFGTNVKQRLWDLSEALRTHAWRPKPLRRVWIPKPDGTRRGLAVPCVEDRVVHAAVARVLYAVFEDAFGPDCYAYVRGRSALDAIARIQQEAAAGKPWGLETDIAKFFDTIPRTRLLDKLATRIADGSFLRLVRSIVASGVLGEASGEDEAGIPQGSPLSPLLANIVLAEFDRRIGGRWSLCRYADDLLVLCASRAEAETARAAVEAALREEGLSLKPEKTRIVHLGGGADFLGYRVTTRGVGPSDRSVKRYREKIRALTQRHETRPLDEVVQRVMRVIRGWSNYFRLARADDTIWRLGSWTLNRLQAYETKHRWQSVWNRDVPTRRLYGLGLRLPYHLLTTRSR